MDYSGKHAVTFFFTSVTERRPPNFPQFHRCRQLICATLIHVPPPPFLCSSNSTHSIFPHGSYLLVLRLIETAFAQATPSRPNIAAGTSQSTNFRLTQGLSTLKFPLMGMVYRTGKYTVCRRVRVSFSPKILQAGE